MDDAEIYSRAHLILREGAGSSLEYIPLDGHSLNIESGGDVQLVESPCRLQNKQIDLLNSLTERLTTSREKEALFSFVKESFKHESPRHDAAWFVLTYLINSGRVGEGLALFYKEFHLCYEYQRILLRLFDLLRFQHPLFSYNDLLAFGRGLAELAEKPNVKRALNWPRFFKTSRSEERTNLATLVLAYQFLVHPLINTLLKRRIEAELVAVVPQIQDETTSLKERLPEIQLSPFLYEALANFEAGFATAHDKFALKNSIGHLRSLMEHLCREILKRTESATGTPFEGDITRPVEVRQYLAKSTVAFLSGSEVNLLSAVYGYISEKAVHSLSVERDDALLCRNLAMMLCVSLIRRLEELEKPQR